MQRKKNSNGFVSVFLLSIVNINIYFLKIVLFICFCVWKVNGKVPGVCIEFIFCCCYFNIRIINRIKLIFIKVTCFLVLIY